MVGEFCPEDDIPEEHKQILDARMKEYDSGLAEFVSWEEVKKRLRRKDKVKDSDPNAI
jgi:putative addiction module component (TIGR02574 family)